MTKSVFHKIEEDGSRTLWHRDNRDYDEYGLVVTYTEVTPDKTEDK